MTKHIAIQIPDSPWAKKPPPDVKFCKPVVGAEGTRPNKTITPNPMKARIATTLIIANQYSNSPNFSTPAAFTPTSSSEKRTIQTHGATEGNHQRQKIAT